jgi:large subunit ribosomal protein L4
MNEPKTRNFANVLSKFSSSKVLVIYPDNDQNVYLSGRNIPNARLINGRDINTFEVLQANDLVIFESSLANII